MATDGLQRFSIVKPTSSSMLSLLKSSRDFAAYYLEVTVYSSIFKTKAESFKLNRWKKKTKLLTKATLLVQLVANWSRKRNCINEMKQ